MINFLLGSISAIVVGYIILKIERRSQLLIEIDAFLTEAKHSLYQKGFQQGQSREVSPDDYSEVASIFMQLIAQAHLRARILKDRDLCNALDVSYLIGRDIVWNGELGGKGGCSFAQVSLKRARDLLLWNARPLYLKCLNYLQGQEQYTLTMKDFPRTSVEYAEQDIYDARGEIKESTIRAQIEEWEEQHRPLNIEI